MKQIFIIILMLTTLNSCKKEAVLLSTDANDIFWLNNAGADMPVWVKGNTASKKIILLVHGGPGDGSYSYTGFETNRLWKQYSIAYWDQRDAGAAAGNNNYANLSINQMIEDLQKLITVLKFRYGNDMEIFLMGHSFGGLLGSGYLVNNDNQKNIKGWIEVDGAHDYPESNTLERQMLIDTGTSEIAKGNYVPQWTTIVNYCNAHPANGSLDIDLQMDNYAAEAEKYENFDHTNSGIDYFSASSPVSLGVNYYNLYYTSAGRQFLESIEHLSYNDQLYKITIPSLLIWGQYDFTVPVASGYHALSNLGSVYKNLVIIPNSGHNPMDSNPGLFAQTVSEFIESVK